MSTSTQPTVPASRFVDKLGDYLSVDELAQYLQLSKETIYHWRLEGTSIFRRIDGSYGTLRIRATSKARARRTLIEAVGEEYEAAHATGDGLTPDSFFVELAHEYMEQTAFTGDQRDTTRHENRRLIQKKIAPLMGALSLRDIKASAILRVYKSIHREMHRQADTYKALISQIRSYAS